MKFFPFLFFAKITIICSVFCVQGFLPYIVYDVFSLGLRQHVRSAALERQVAYIDLREWVALVDLGCNKC